MCVPVCVYLIQNWKILSLYRLTSIRSIKYENVISLYALTFLQFLSLLFSIIKHILYCIIAPDP